MRTQRFWILALCIGLASTFAPFAEGADERDEDPDGKEPVVKDRLAADKESLARLQDYVGSWRGVGQIRRGSSDGAWTEESQWTWQFEKNVPALAFTAKKGKFLVGGILKPADEAEHYELRTRSIAEGPELKYRGRLDDKGQLVLDLVPGDGTPESAPHRVSIRLVANGDRLLVLLEQRTGEDRYRRLAEVGYTREGSRFGKGTSYIECVVTGGKGTIPVTHEGKTYYVCCTGCRDYFNEDPDHVLAEYRKRKQEEEKRAEEKGSH